MIKNNKTHYHKILSISIFYALIILAFGIYFLVLHQQIPVKINGIYIKNPPNITEFRFTDNHGLVFSKKNLQGHWSMLFFGFTNCQFICPTTMAELNKMYGDLQSKLPENQLPSIVFISVDPENDTIEKINQFVTSFNSHFIGIRANLAETIVLEKQVHIATSDNPINHSADIVLLNPKVQAQ